ncbi:MAG: phospholipid carrier-dependent glycosyltransferase, partial [Candidatus Woesearchaeota archaeon]
MVFKIKEKIWLIILIFIILKIFTINSELYKTPLWDETVYLGMGKYLYSYGNSGLWESIRPIGLPIITGLMWTIGEQILFTKILLIIFSSLLIYITYLLSLSLSSNKKTSIISVTLLVITPVFINNSSKILTEIPSALFMTLGIYLLIKYKYNNKILFLSGFSLGLSFLFKFPSLLSGIVSITIIIYSIFKEKEVKHDKNKNIKKYYKTYKYIYKILLFSLGIFTVSIPFLFFNYLMYGTHMSFLKATFLPILAGAVHQNNYFQSIIITDFYSAVQYMFFYFFILFKNNILLLLFLPGIIIVKNKKHNIIKLTIIIFLLYLTIISNKQERFILLILPLICVISSQTINQIYEYVHKRLEIKKLIFNSVIYIIIFITAAFSIINLYNDVFEQKNKYDDNFIRELNNIKGPILSTNPTYVIYTNEKIIPLYNVLNKHYYLKEIDELYINPWEKNIEPNSAIYDPSGFPCDKDNYYFACNEYKKKI